MKSWLWLIQINFRTKKRRKTKSRPGLFFFHSHVESQEHSHRAGASFLIQGWFIMGSDPAFLFYPNDYIGGTMGMTFEEKGAYIELLMMQFNRGHMSLDMINRIVGPLWVGIQGKFIKDSVGLYYNKRLDTEKEKRRSYTLSRNNNLTGKNQHSRGHMGGHTTSHMENRNRNINDNVIKDKAVNTINKKVKKSNITNVLMLERFEGIWSRYPNKDGKKAALFHFKTSVKTEKDWKDINAALDTYLEIKKVKEGFVKNGSTWFNNWQDFINFQEPKTLKEIEDERTAKYFVSA